LPASSSTLTLFLSLNHGEGIFIPKFLCTMITSSSLISRLNSIANSDEDTILKLVANEALDRDESDLENWFMDLFTHGCQSGMVSFLIYYTDTNNFFDKYYDEIMELKVEYEENTGLAMTIPYQLKNHLAWFSFEQSAYKLYYS